MVLIFGKDTCPYTQAARDHYTDAACRSSTSTSRRTRPTSSGCWRSAAGQREVPVIVEGGKVTIGFGGT